MPNRRDTQTYELRQGRKVVYRGTTNNPERREKEHKNQGKTFTKMNLTSRKMTVDGAKRKEAEQLKAYRNNHQGKNPKYNKDTDG